MTLPPLIRPVLVHDLASPDPAGPPGCDQADLATGAGAPLHSRSLADMLVISTTVGMLHWIHRHTTNLGPAVPLHFEFVVGAASFQHRLVNPTAARHQTDHCAIGAGNDLLVAGGQLHPCALSVSVMGDHRGVVAARPGKLPAVAGLLLQVAHITIGNVMPVGHMPEGTIV